MLTAYTNESEYQYSCCSVFFKPRTGCFLAPLILRPFESNDYSPEVVGYEGLDYTRKIKDNAKYTQIITARKSSFHNKI